MSNVTSLSAARISRDKSKRLEGGSPRSNTPAKPRKSRITSSPRSTVSPYEADADPKQVEADLGKTRKALEGLYPGTFMCWKTMLGRQKTEGAEIAPEWRRFHRFLADMGPRRHAELTLDRFDPANPIYGPNLCRWADKRQQANNRTTTVMVPDPETGAPTPVSVVAERYGVKPNTFRKALREGKSVAEIVGRTQEPPKPKLIPPHRDPAKRWPWPLDAAKLRLWKDAYRVHRKTFSSGYEWPWEFAIRTLEPMVKKAFEQAHSHIDPYPEDQVPDEAAEQFNKDMASAKLIGNLLSEAKDGYQRWRGEIQGRQRKQPPQSRPQSSYYSTYDW